MVTVSSTAHRQAGGGLDFRDLQGERSYAMKMGNVLLARSGEMGALPILSAATMPDAEGGGYFGPDGIAEARGHPRPVGSSSAARDEQAAPGCGRCRSS